MVQNVSKQFLEATMKYAQMASQNLYSSDKSAFKSCMNEVSNKRDAASYNDKLGKKDVQKPKEQQPKNDATGTDTKTKDDSVETADDKLIVDDSSNNEKDSKNTDEVAQNLIDLAAMAMQMSENIVKDEQKPIITNVAIKDVPLGKTEAMPVMTKHQAEQLTAAIIPDTQEAEKLTAKSVKLHENLKATVNSEVLSEKPMEAEPLVIKTETLASKARQVVNNGETAQNTKTNVENAEAPKEALSKVGEAKPIEIKVEVKTQESETQTGKQGKTEETTDAAVITAKPEKAEMPTITVKVGDGGQFNTGEMAQDVADAIIKKMPQKPNEFEIQITPKELGNITIKLLFENGQTLVSLSAGNAKTAGLLSECAKTIGAMIQQHTGNETVVTVQDDKSFTDQQKQEGNRQNAESQQQENAKKQQRQQGASQDFVQQMRLGLFDGEFSESKSRFY